MTWSRSIYYPIPLHPFTTTLSLPTLFSNQMASATASDELLHDLSPLLKVYTDGRVQRFLGTTTVPPSLDPLTGVQSKDVVVSPDIGVSARIYIPKSPISDQKLPLLIYFHGGAFCIESAFSPTYHNYLNSLVAQANVVVFSVDYRLVPEYPLPAAFHDCWVALKWVFGDAPDPWLTHHADFQRVFLAGDSAGANISHHMALRVGSEKPDGMNLAGVILIHPYFWGKDPIGAEAANPQVKVFIDNLWKFACPESSGSDDPLINPAIDPTLSKLGCSRVLICVAEKDALRDRGWHYYEALGKCGWGGAVEMMEAPGEGHVFHLINPTAENAVAMLKRVSSFLNMDKP